MRRIRREGELALASALDGHGHAASDGERAEEDRQQEDGRDGQHAQDDLVLTASSTGSIDSPDDDVPVVRVDTRHPEARAGDVDGLRGADVDGGALGSARSSRSVVTVPSAAICQVTRSRPNGKLPEARTRAAAARPGASLRQVARRCATPRHVGRGLEGDGSLETRIDLGREVHRHPGDDGDGTTAYRGATSRVAHEGHARGLSSDLRADAGHAGSRR